MAARPTECFSEDNGRSAAGQLVEWALSTRGLLNIWPYRVVRISLAAAFLGSGIIKLLNPVSFVVVIDAYGLIPESWNMPVAVSLASLEALAGLALFFDIRASLSIVAALLCLFMAILGYGIWMGLDIDCGCFGPEDPEADAYHGLRPALYRDFGMMLGVAYLYLWRYGRSRGPVSISHCMQKIVRRRGKA